MVRRGLTARRAPSPLAQSIIPAYAGHSCLFSPTRAPTFEAHLIAVRRTDVFSVRSARAIVAGGGALPHEASVEGAGGAAVGVTQGQVIADGLNDLAYEGSYPPRRTAPSALAHVADKDWLDVDDRRPVDRFEVADLHSVAFDGRDLDPMKPDWVRPVGRTGGEHPLLGPRGVAAGMYAQDVSHGEVEPGQDENLVAEPYSVERCQHIRLPQEVGAAPETTLARLAVVEKLRQSASLSRSEESVDVRDGTLVVQR